MTSCFSLGLGEGRLLRYRVLVLVLTFLSYASYHMSRKAPSIVKGTLHPHVESSTSASNWNPVTNPGWSPFSDDLNPTKVARVGYKISGSSVCQINDKFDCTGTQVSSYHDLVYCPRFNSSKFSLHNVNQTNSVRAKALCDKFGVVEDDGCWIISGRYDQLTDKERKSVCIPTNTSEGHDCTIYVQASGHLIPAPHDDDVNWRASSDVSQADITVVPNMVNGKVLLGSLDTVYLVFYAIGLFFSGHLADHSKLNVFLGLGMMGSGVFVAAIGFAEVFNIHNIYYFYACFAAQGLCQSTGWPAVVAVTGNWINKSTRGMVMGIWNAHTSVGNILGSVISAAALGMGMHGNDWPAAYFVSGGVIGGMGLVILIFLPSHPHDVGLPSPEETEKKEALLQSPLHVPGSDTSGKKTTSGTESGSTFVRALCIPGVMEFAMALFFAKFVAYMFIYWLPYYLGHLKFSATEAANLSTAFDVGGIVGGIFAGWISDRIGRRSPVGFMYLVLAVPSLFFYRYFSASIGDSSVSLNILLMLVCGAFVNGPYALITTAVSADLGQHPSLEGDLSLTATVTGIIDGTGSIGASIQGVLIGFVASNCNTTNQSSWDAVFYLLMICCALSATMLVRLVFKDAPEQTCRVPYQVLMVTLLLGLLGITVFSLIQVVHECGAVQPCTNLAH